MRRDLLKRIEALEARVGAGSVVLHMPNGGRHMISARLKHWLRLKVAIGEEHRALCAGEPPPSTPLAAQLKWLREAIRIDESAQMFQLLAALAKSAFREKVGQQ